MSEWISEWMNLWLNDRFCMFVGLYLSKFHKSMWQCECVLNKKIYDRLNEWLNEWMNNWMNESMNE